MKLTIVENDTNYPILKIVSENNIWELGISQPTIFKGLRVSAGLIGTESYDINYCCGTDVYLAVEVLKQVVEIFYYLPEEITVIDLYEYFPYFEIKPINLNENYIFLENNVKLLRPLKEDEEVITLLKVVEVTALIILEQLANFFNFEIYENVQKAQKKK